MLIPIILAGGSGSRLWPLSRRMHPKQFLSLAGAGSMLQETIIRLSGIEHAPPIVVCNEEHRFLVAEQIRDIGIDDVTIILEPFGKNTAPAIAVAAYHALQQDEKAKLLILAADHIIENKSLFYSAINTALDQANTGSLVTFGVTPQSAETGYGYIRRGESIGNSYKVSAFVEKPDLATAKTYLESGEYYWNSGMFLFEANSYIEELKRYRADIAQAAIASYQAAEMDLDFIRLDREAFENCPSESIDYAVMEKTDRAALVPLDAGWNDIGSWSALWEIDEKDEHNNAIHGDVLLFNTKNSLIHAENRLVTTVGLEDIVVIETKDAVLVAKKDQAQNVKQIVENLRASERPEDQFHRVVYRPWGHFDCIEEDLEFKVKRITVKPGQRTSIQMHHHRSEHWVVVSGTAQVTKGDNVVLVAENESIYINVGEKHALENPGAIPLELIEVQTGSYLGEDDIVRFDDLYGREDN